MFGQGRSFIVTGMNQEGEVFAEFFYNIVCRRELKDARLLCIKIDSTYTVNIAEIPCSHLKNPIRVIRWSTYTAGNTVVKIICKYI